MKTHKHIFEEIVDFQNLYAAYLEARRNKRYRTDVLVFTKHLERNLITIQQKLIDGTYEVGKYRQFYVYEPKKRLIMALPFSDRVVQWAIYLKLNPIYDKGFIEDSFGCRNGKGTHNAANRLQYWLKQISRHCKETGDKYYYLKLDVKKFFYRVDHDILMSILRRKINDNKLMELLEKIINGKIPFGIPFDYAGDDYPMANRLYDIGMPIGNLTSQLFANIYLNELDQYCKHILKCHYYIRYMDDIIILDNDKNRLHMLRERIECFINNELKLHLNNKTAIRPVDLGIDFVGFQMWATHRFLKKKSALKIKRDFTRMKIAYANNKIDLDDIKPSVQSYLGIMKHANTYNMRKGIFKRFVLRRNSTKKEVVE